MQHLLKIATKNHTINVGTCVMGFMHYTLFERMLIDVLLLSKLREEKKNINHDGGRTTFLNLVSTLAIHN